MAPVDEDASPTEVDLEAQHEEIVTYLRPRFRSFMEDQSQDIDRHGSKTPHFRERDKQSLMQVFDVACDSFGRSYSEIKLTSHLRDTATISRVVKRLNYFLEEFSRKNGLHSDYPIQLFSYHGESDKIYQVNLHFACARTQVTTNHRIYSIDNIPLAESLRRGRGDTGAVGQSVELHEQGGVASVVKYIHAVPLDPKFVGRRRELKSLNEAWESDGIYVATVVSWGGFGKSVLVRQWLEELNTSTSVRYVPQRILWWSFYQNDSVDAFVETAMSCLCPNAERRERPYYMDEAFDVLITMLAKYPSILVLDGFEDMQYSQAGDYFGKCKSHPLGNFIRRIGEGECPQCLCVITSRLPIIDIVAYEHESCINLNLEKSPLSVTESRLLLRRHGVKGDDETLGEIIQDHGRHPLALVTIATLLSNFFAGDARKAGSMPSVAVPKTVVGDRFKLWRTFSWYDSLLSNAERHILRAVSLFRQVAPWGLLIAFLEARGNAIRTKDVSHETMETEVRAIVFHLSQLQLLKNDRHSDACFLHPLWKAFFEYTTDAASARDYHDVLFGLLQVAAPHRPDTLREMWPLIEAVYHGCKCGRIEESLTVFRERIERKAGYLTKNLAAWETKLDLCSMFFSDRHFSGRCLLDDAEEESHVLNAAGFAYMNLGLPVKAIPLYDRAAEICRVASLQGAEGQVHRNRADAFLRVGDLRAAVDAAENAVELDQSPKSQQSSLAYLGYAHALLGSFDLADAAFNKALALFGQDWLPPIRGIQYIETLIMRERYDEALRKSRKALLWTREQKVLFGEAECVRVLGGAMGGVAITSGNHRTARNAIRLMERAVDLASRAGVHYYMARTSLESARIVLTMTLLGIHTLEMPDIERIIRQVSQVLRIARESSYRLIEAEALLARTYIHVVGGDGVRASKELTRAAHLAGSLKCQWLENRCAEVRRRIS